MGRPKDELMDGPKDGLIGRPMGELESLQA